MAGEQNEQNQQDGSFQLNRDLSSAQIPEIPQAEQIQYATQQPLRNTVYTYGTSIEPVNPSALPEKLKRFFTKPLGKIILFTVLFLGIAAMIMYSTNSVGLQGSFNSSIEVPPQEKKEVDKPAAATPAADSPAAPVVTSIEPTSIKPGATDSPITLKGKNLAFLNANPKAITSNSDTIISAGYTDNVSQDGTSIRIFVNVKKDASGPTKVTIKNDAGGSADFTINIDGAPTPPLATNPTITSIVPDTIKPGDSDKGITLTGTNLAFLSQNIKAITFDDPLVASAGYTDGFIDGKIGHIFLNVDKKITEGAKKITITNDKNESASFSINIKSASSPKPQNTPPLAPTWTAPAAAAELSLTDLAKIQFTWTAGVDADKSPSPTPNYQFAIIKGELTDQQEITTIFDTTKTTATAANEKFGFAWFVKWTEKAPQEEIQKLLGLTNCVNDIGNNNFAYFCNKFMVPAKILSTMKEGQKYTAIVQQGDGDVGSAYATTVFSIKKQEDCPTDQYYIKDSKNAGCKKIPSFKGAFVQTGFICGLYKTILDNKENSYRINTETKATLKTNLDTQCTKKPDAITNTCLTKMTYIPSGKTLCEPLKIITDPILAKDVCDQYIAEKNNKSLSADTGKQIATIMGAQCKPKLCPTGKFLNGLLVPDNCVDVISFPTKLSDYEVTKSCNTLKAISDAVTALATYQIDQATFDMIKKVSKSDDCAQKFPAADVKDPLKNPSNNSSVENNKTICEKGFYFEGKDCKKLPTLTSASLAEIDSNCKLYSDLLSGKTDGKLEPSTKLQIKELAGNVLCEQATKYTADDDTSTAPPSPGSAKKSFNQSTANDDTSTAPPSLGMATKKTVVQEPKLQPTLQPVQSNVLDSLNEAPPSLSYSPPKPKVAPTLPAAWTTTPKSATPAATYTPQTPKYYEPLPATQTTNYQPTHPVAGSYIPRSTAKTGPEIWIYSFGLAFATIGARKWKNRR